MVSERSCAYHGKAAVTHTYYFWCPSLSCEDPDFCLMSSPSAASSSLVQSCWGKFFHLWMSETVFILPSFFRKICALGKEFWVVRFYVSSPFSMMLQWLLEGTVRLGFSHVMTGWLGPMHREARFLSTAGKPLVLS